MKVAQTIWTLGVMAVLTSAAQAAENRPSWVTTEADSPTGNYLVIDLTSCRIAMEKQTDPDTPPKTMEGFVVSNLAAVPPGGWTDEYKTTKLVLRRIPAGTFTMGSPADELGRDSDEAQHAVTISKDFYIGVFEVTMRQWELVMGKAVPGHWKQSPKGERVPDAIILPELHRRPVETITFYEIRENPVTDAKTAREAIAKTMPPPDPKKPAIDRKPDAGKKPGAGAGVTVADEDEQPELSEKEIEAKQKQLAQEKNAAKNALDEIMAQPSHDPNVDWPANSAVTPGSFFGKLRAKTMLAGIDLPTEAQWEYACRAGTTTALNSGKALTQERECPNLAEVGRYLFNVDPSEAWRYNRSDVLGTAGAGSYAPNKWGLYDMHGNVWEWCLDWYAPLSSEAATDPKGPATGQAHVLRGGSCDDRAKACRAANRGSAGVPSGKSGFFGFRVAMTAP
jgi:formylglycine-generating enzyme required for sulfatase activity